MNLLKNSPATVSQLYFSPDLNYVGQVVFFSKSLGGGKRLSHVDHCPDVVSLHQGTTCCFIRSSLLQLVRKVVFKGFVKHYAHFWITPGMTEFSCFVHALNRKLSCKYI